MLFKWTFSKGHSNAVKKVGENQPTNQLTISPFLTLSLTPSFHCLLHTRHFIYVLSFNLYHTPESKCCVFVYTDEETRAQRGYVARKWSI